MKRERSTELFSQTQECGRFILLTETENKEMKMVPSKTSKSPEEREFVVDSGAVNAHDEQKRYKIQNLHCGAYEQWRSANKRGSTSIRSRS